MAFSLEFQTQMDKLGFRLPQLKISHMQMVNPQGKLVCLGLIGIGSEDWQPSEFELYTITENLEIQWRCKVIAYDCTKPMIDVIRDLNLKIKRFSKSHT
jgi:hypothetical protein